MKLLMISGDRSVLRDKRGAFWYTLQELHAHFERIDILCPYVPFMSTREEFGNVFFHACPKGLWYQPWWILKEGQRLIKMFGHNVMTVHEYPPFYNGLGAAMLHNKTGIPYALEIHHIVGHPVAASFTEWMGKILSRLFLHADTKRAAAVRVVNEEVKKTLTSWGVPTEKMHVVPSFYLDASILKPAAHIQKKYDIAFCARLVANKGLDVLLQALRDIPDVTLVVIGDGPKRAAYERLAKTLGIHERVTFTGWLPEQRDMAAHIQSAKIFVMCSKSEGGPRVALEAMAMGMPVIATPVGVMPDVIRDGDNGILTDGTVFHLINSIRLLLSDSDRREHLGHEATHIIRRFERSESVERYARFLQVLK